MVDASQIKNDLGRWIEPKKRLRRMTNRLLSANMHIILCARGKEPMVIEDAPGGKQKLVKGPVVPIQEKSLRFDMTVIGHMLGDGRFTVTAPAGKCPGFLRPVFATGEVMNEEMGQKLAEWVAGADAKSPAHRQLELAATAAAEAGVEAFRTFWKRTDKEERAYLKPTVSGTMRASPVPPVTKPPARNRNVAPPCTIVPTSTIHSGSRPPLIQWTPRSFLLPFGHANPSLLSMQPGMLCQSRPAAHHRRRPDGSDQG